MSGVRVTLAGNKSRRASRVVRGALAVGALLIIGAAVARAFREARVERACNDQVSTCAERCGDPTDRACELLAARCRRGEKQACQALERKFGTRRVW